MSALNGLPMGERKFVERMPVHAPAGDVDQEIDAAVFGCDRIESRFDSFFVGQIERNGNRAGYCALAKLGATLLAGISIHVQDDDLIILLGEPLDDGLTDFPAPPVTTAILLMSAPPQLVFTYRSAAAQRQWCCVVWGTVPDFDNAKP